MGGRGREEGTAVSSAFAPLWRRETEAFFRTSIAFTGGVFFLVLTGVAFWLQAGRLAAGGPAGAGADAAMDAAAAGLPEAFWASPWCCLAGLLLATMLTMRLFAEEIRMGTLETLMAAPVTEAEVVLSKFAAAGTVYALMWLPALAYPAVARACGIQIPPSGAGVALAGYLGMMLLGGVFLSAGLFCSLLTKHQVVAAMLSFGVLGVWVSGGLLALRGGGEVAGAAALLRALSAPQHMRDFAAGILDTRTLVFHLSAAALLLFASVRLLEARRLR